MGYLKGKSSLMIFDRHANLKYKYGNRHFWCRGYYVKTAGADTRAIQAYIQNQLAEDQSLEQMTFTEYIDPFTGILRQCFLIKFFYKSGDVRNKRCIFSIIYFIN